MAVILPRNPEELQKFFKALDIPKIAQPIGQGVRELQIAAGEKSAEVLRSQDPSTLAERIASREISPPVNFICIKIKDLIFYF